MVIDMEYFQSDQHINQLEYRIPFFYTVFYWSSLKYNDYNVLVV